MRTLVLAPVCLVLILFASHGPVAAGETRLLSGCLTNDGNVVKLSLGGAPNRPCNERQVRLSFDVSGMNGPGSDRLSLGHPDTPVGRDREAGAVMLRLHFPF